MTGRKERGTNLIAWTHLSGGQRSRSGNVSALLEHAGVLGAEEVQPETLFLFARKARPLFFGHALNRNGDPLLVAEALLARARNLQPHALCACRRGCLPFVRGERPDLLIRQRPRPWREHRQPYPFRMLSCACHIATLLWEEP